MRIGKYIEENWQKPRCVQERNKFWVKISYFMKSNSAEICIFNYLARDGPPGSIVEPDEKPSFVHELSFGVNVFFFFYPFWIRITLNKKWNSGDEICWNIERHVNYNVDLYFLPSFTYFPKFLCNHNLHGNKILKINP